MLVTQYGRLKAKLRWVDLRQPGRWQTLSLPWDLKPADYDLHLKLYDMAGNFSRVSAVIMARRAAQRH